MSEASQTAYQRRELLAYLLARETLEQYEDRYGSKLVGAPHYIRTFKALDIRCERQLDRIIRNFEKSGFGKLVEVPHV